MFLTSLRCSDLGAGNYANLKSSLLSINEALPPEELFIREVGAALEVNTLDKVIIFANAFDSAPEVPPLKSVL
jgi:hypothetical protein